MVSPDLSLSELALAHPAASRILRQYQLDFCCGGKRSLGDVCHERGIDPEQLLARIEADGAPLRKDVRDLAPSELIALLIGSYHEAHRRELPDLIELAEKVERVHAGKPEAPRGLTAHLRQLFSELDAHMRKEEAVLFPAILGGAGAGLGTPIAVLEREHEAHGASLRRLRELAWGFVPPHAACTSWRALYLRCGQFEADLMTHVHLENALLFPRALGGAV